MLGLQFFASSRPLVPNGSAQFPISGETGEYNAYKGFATPWNPYKPNYQTLIRDKNGNYVKVK
jgi:hypothetical protein